MNPPRHQWQHRGGATVTTPATITAHRHRHRPRRSLSAEAALEFSSSGAAPLRLRLPPSPWPLLPPPDLTPPVALCASTPPSCLSEDGREDGAGFVDCDGASVSPAGDAVCHEGEQTKRNFKRGYKSTGVVEETLGPSQRRRNARGKFNTRPAYLLNGYTHAPPLLIGYTHTPPLLIRYTHAPPSCWLTSPPPSSSSSSKANDILLFWRRFFLSAALLFFLSAFLFNASLASCSAACSTKNRTHNNININNNNNSN